MGTFRRQFARLEAGRTGRIPGWWQCQDAPKRSGLAVAVALLLGLCAVSAPARSCIPSPAGLVGSWRGENSADDLVAGTQGRLVNNATFTDGFVGQAFSFDGNRSGAILDDSVAYHLQDFTIEAWIRRQSPSITTPEPGGGEVFGYGHRGYCLGIENDGSLYLTKVGIDHVALLKAVTDTSFHHVAVTKNGSKVVFFVDGRAYPMPPYHTTFEFSSPPALGIRGDYLLGSFMGTIDEVGLYKRALSADEIKSIYHAGSAGKCADPLVREGAVSGQALSVAAAPSLTITRAGENVVLSWPANYSNYYLETCPDLGSGDWSTAKPSSSVQNGPNLTITLPTAHDSRWYRLRSR